MLPRWFAFWKSFTTKNGRYSSSRKHLQRFLKYVIRFGFPTWFFRASTYSISRKEITKLYVKLVSKTCKTLDRRTSTNTANVFTNTANVWKNFSTLSKIFAFLGIKPLGKILGRKMMWDVLGGRDESERRRAESQWIVAARPLCHLQYPVAYLSRLQRILPATWWELYFMAARTTHPSHELSQRHVPLGAEAPTAGRQTGGGHTRRF